MKMGRTTRVVGVMRSAVMKFSCLIVVCLTISAARANVDLPFEDGSEAYDVGHSSPGPWQTLFSGASATVSTDWASGGTKSLKVVGSPNWSRMEYVTLNTLPTVLIYEATVHIGNSVSRPRVGFMFMDPRYPNQGPMANAFNTSGLPGAGDITWVGKEGEVTHLLPYSVGDSFRLRAEIDGDSETADVFVYDLDDNLLAHEVDLPAWPHLIPAAYPESDPFGVDIILDQFGVADDNWPGGGTSLLYYDDVKVIPEPATLVPLALGGSAALALLALGGLAALSLLALGALVALRRRKK